MASGSAAHDSEELIRDLTLDDTKLAAATSSDQGDVFVLQWLSRAERALSLADQETLQSVRASLEASLLKLVHCPAQRSDDTSSPSLAQATPVLNVPKPGRATRQLLARCIVILYSRVDTRSFFDTMQSLMQLAGEEAKGKVAEREVRVSALFVVGEVFGSLGQQVMSLFVELTLLCQRLVKASANPVILRYHALVALNKALLVAGKSLSDQSGKDLLKLMRQGLADRAGAIVRGCADCLLSLSRQTSFLSTRNEIETIMAASVRAIEQADFVTKRAVSRMAAGLLASTQAENSAPPPPPPKKSKKKREGGAGEGSDDEEVSQPPMSAAADGPGRTMMSLVGMLEQLSHPFLRPSTSRKTRAAILDIYATLFETLGPAWVSANYGAILDHLLDHVLNHSSGVANSADALSIRTGVGIILRKLIGERMLGEQAQVLAVQAICQKYLQRWPAVMPEQQPPSKETLSLGFNEISGLLVQLGSSPPQVQEALYDPLMRCLGHPSHSVQVSAAWCLRTLCDVSPGLLSSTISAVLELLNRDLTTLVSGGGATGVGQVAKRAHGHSRALAALISVIPRRPLYTSFAISAKVLSLAIQLLKNSGNHELSVSAVEIEVAWTLVGALMSLGPNFVRLHLPQLLILWRNALPKPTSKDTAAGPSSRSDGEWGFLLHVRECALGSLLSFLLHNGTTLIMLDTARRIVALLSNTLAFVNGFSSQHPHLLQEQNPGADKGPLTLHDRENLLRRRLFQCLTILATNPAMEPIQAGLVPAAVQVFAEPDRYIGSAAQAAIAASAGNFTGIWTASDGYAFGVTSLQRDAETIVSDPISSLAASKVPAAEDWLNRDSVEVLLDALQRRPVLGAAEHDVLMLYVGAPNAPDSSSSWQSIADSPLLSPPAATGVVDSAIELFAALLPYQDRDMQVSALETLLAHSRSAKLDRNPGRKQAIQMNAMVAVLGTLRTAIHGGTGASGKRPSGFNNERLSSAMRELIQDALLQSDPPLRCAASEAYGKLAAVAGSHAMSGQVQFLVDQVVSNRDPDARAGCALAFGAIYREVGGLSAGPLTKTVVNVLMSLSNDPHPTVHYNALEALQMVVDSASLSYSPYVASTLGMLVKLYMLDTHEPEGGSAGSVNLRADLPAHQGICRVINALIGVLGPDLPESAKVRGLIFSLLREFVREADTGVVVEATKATQHFGLFAAEELETAAWIARLRTHLRSNTRPLKLAAINAFYQLVQREALAMSRLGGDQLVEEFFAQLDEDPRMDGVREVITSWLGQTADLAPGGWIDLCQRIMSASSNRGSAAAAAAALAASAQKHTQSLATALQDDEVATIDLGADSGSKLNANGGSRWRTQLFALQCLHEVFVTVRRSGKLEHFSTPPDESAAGGQKRLLMSSRVADLIKMAFSASTAANSEIRLEGLVVLRDVIENFKHTRDPDFREALLLEQHQAPIAAALTPAFLADSTPEVLSAAVQLCAVFVGSGVIREVDRMGRILKQLISALDSCLEPTMERLGDVEDLSPNANAMLKVAVFTAWAELQVASVKQDYLIQVVKPHIAKIAPFWIACLREYAKIRSDPDAEGLGGPGVGPVINTSLDSQYAGLAREVITPYYDGSWFKILNAVAVLMNANDPSILRAMDGQPTTGPEVDESKPPSAARSGSEPALFFFVLYGLAFEALSSSSAGDEASQEATVMRIALQAMSSLSKPVYAGSALLQDSIFEELCNLSYRLVMTEPPSVQISVLEMVGGIAAGYGKLLLKSDDEKAAEAKSLPKSSKLTHCLRVVICVLQSAKKTRGSPEEKAALLRVAYSAFIGIIGIFPAALQEDLFAVGFYMFSETLRDETSEVDLVGPTLSSLKDLCERAVRASKPGSELLQRAVHGFLSAALQYVDDMRTRAGRIADNKTKNSLLAATVVMTSIPVTVKISQAVAEHVCYLIVQKIRFDDGDGDTTDAPPPEVAMTAVQCARSLILASSKGNPALQFCVGQLMPGLVEFVVTEGPKAAAAAANSKAPTNASAKRPRTTAVEEIVKAFVGMLHTLPVEHRSQALGIILPTLLILLEPRAATSAAPPSCVPALHAFTIQQLMTIAAQHQAHFKEAMAALDAERRSLLESSIRAHLAGGRPTGGVASSVQRSGAAASIALKSFGS
ncbi:hypothetical protein ACQY0O_000838 [Thecaphora frezii]